MIMISYVFSNTPFWIINNPAYCNYMFYVILNEDQSYLRKQR